MEALLYSPLENNGVRCNLCCHRCKIKPGRRGLCQVRVNREGTLETLVYNRIIAQHVDPIEKKPLFHFYPGTLSYSIATVGCNFKCRFCQNADIAQLPADQEGKIIGHPVAPASIVSEAIAANCKSIAYTYTEPTIFFELALETAKLAHQNGLKNIFVTNGYMTPEALDMIQPYLDAANVDLKSFRDEYYQTYCGARLKHVLQTLKKMRTLGVFLEITTLIIPGLNDEADELKALAEFILTELGAQTPWHISRFHPTYKLTDRPPTPVNTLIAARDIGVEAGLKHVFIGNVPGHDGENTYCSQCGGLLIDRWGFRIHANRLTNSACPDCGMTVEGRGL